MKRHIVIPAVALVLSAVAFGAQEYALARYGLTLKFGEWLWLQLGIGWAFVLSGVVAERAQPESGIGRWFWVIGTIWIGRLVFVPPLIQWETIGLVALYGLFAVVLFTYPSGRVLGQWRPLAIAYISVVTVFAVAITATFDFYAWVDDPVCCPSHLLLISHQPDLNQALLTIGGAIVAAAVLALVAVLVLRYRRGSRVVRRSVIVTSLAAVPLAIVVVVMPIVSATTSGFSAFEVADAADTRSTMWIQAIVLAALPIVLAIDLVRTRYSKSRVADMVIAIDPAMSASQLQAQVQKALADPSARLAFAGDTDGELVGVNGNTVITADGQDRTAIADDAYLIHDRAVGSDERDAAARAVSLAISNARLEAQLRAQLAVTRESRQRIVSATDDERRRIERDLHDGAQQRLVALAATLAAARRGDSTVPDDLAALLDQAAGEAEAAMGELRDLARGVHPAILEQAGLKPAIESLGDRSPVPVTVDIDPGRFPSAIETAAYFIAAEAITNAAKHARASEVTVRARVEGGLIRLDVADDGEGGLDPAKGSGIRGLEDRSMALGGSLTYESGPDGTTIHATIPISEGG